MTDFDWLDTQSASKKAKRQRKTPKNDLEGPVVKECLAWLRACPQVLYVERRNTGAVFFEGGGAIRFGSKGAADIWCLVSRKCPTCDDAEQLWHVEIECKRRDGKGRQSEDQKDFEAQCQQIGVPYFLVKSADELRKEIESLTN